MNGVSGLPGLGDPATKLRFELQSGAKDPWGQNAWFGIRQIEVIGKTNTDMGAMGAAEVLKMAASYRLNNEVIDAESQANAAGVDDAESGIEGGDATAYVPSNRSVLEAAVEYIHELIESSQQG